MQYPEVRSGAIAVHFLVGLVSFTFYVYFSISLLFFSICFLLDKKWSTIMLYGNFCSTCNTVPGLLNEILKIVKTNKNKFTNRKWERIKKLRWWEHGFYLFFMGFLSTIKLYGNFCSPCNKVQGLEDEIFKIVKTNSQIEIRRE